MIIHHPTVTPTFITPEGKAVCHVKNGDSTEPRLIGPRGGVSSSYDWPTDEDAPRPRPVIQTGAGTFGAGRDKTEQIAAGDGPDRAIVVRPTYYELYTVKR